MGMLKVPRAAMIAVVIIAMQVCPVWAQKDQTDEPQGRSRVVKVAHALFVSGLALSALDYGHRREVCTGGTCVQERRKVYSWGAAISLAGATVGYTRVAADKRSSVRISPTGIAARFAW